jgi:hypothetical protein
VFVVILALEFLIEPLAPVFAGGTNEEPLDFPVGARFELAYAVLAVDDQRQRWRLNATDGGQVEAARLRVEGGHRTRAIDADQPVRFRAADGSVAQALHLGAAAQAREAVSDGLRGHRLQPQALDRFAILGVLNDVVEDQLTLRGRRRRR